MTPHRFTQRCPPALWLLALLLPALLLLPLAAALGQDAAAPEPDKAPRELPARQDTGATDGDTRADKSAPRAPRPGEVFKPFEEISEDLSVPFPVDI